MARRFESSRAATAARRGGSYTDYAWATPEEPYTAPDGSEAVARGFAASANINVFANARDASPASA
jgi:hypothetical protein